MPEPRRKHDARGSGLIGEGNRRGRGANVAGVLEVLFLPELFELFRVIRGQRRGIDRNDIVFHQHERAVPG